MLDYLFKGLVTVNNKHDNSTRTSKCPSHSYDTTFLVVVAICLLVALICWFVYKSLVRKARRRVADPAFTPLWALRPPQPTAPQNYSPSV